MAPRSFSGPAQCAGVGYCCTAAWVPREHHLGALPLMRPRLFSPGLGPGGGECRTTCPRRHLEAVWIIKGQGWARELIWHSDQKRPAPVFWVMAVMWEPTSGRKPDFIRCNDCPATWPSREDYHAVSAQHGPGW